MEESPKRNVIDIHNNNANHNYINGFGIIINRNQAVNHINMAAKLSDPMELLKKYHVPFAAFDTLSLGNHCAPDTRVGLLKEAIRIITSPDGSPVVWISGVAGSGKTSIALSLCDILAKENTVLLGGSFFFSRAGSSIKRTISRYMVPTLATLLVRAEPACKKALVAELKRNPEFVIKIIKYQIDNLLVTPLASLAPSNRQVVFVIDGLDQCSSEQQLRELVLALADFECQVPVKFVVTARPDPRIRKMRVHRRSLHPRIELYSVNLALVTADIQHFIQTEFAGSPATPKWYSDRDPPELAEKADGIFGFAAVAVRYILSPKETTLRLKRLCKVKELKAKGLEGLDEMYSFILSQATGRSSSKADRIRTIISTIIASRTPLQVKTLANLLCLKSIQIRESLLDLHAIVFVPESDEDGELRMLETTFVDFFVKDARGDKGVGESHGHDTLVRHYLQRLTADDLCFNVSNVRSSYDAHPPTEPGIAPSLRDACMLWPYHFYNATVPSVHEVQINSFLRKKFLFWLEVTSQIIEADHSPQQLLEIAASKAESEDLSAFLRDAISFVKSFQEAIEFSPAHIYISALPFTPKDSLVYQIFYPLFSGLVFAVDVGTDSQNKSKITVAAVSPDGRVIVSAASDGSAQMLKAGEKDIKSLDHEGQVRSVTFSTNSRFIATGSSDTTVQIRSAATGQPVMAPQYGHQDAVQAVAFSPDTTRLASGSVDKTTRVWKITVAAENLFQRIQIHVAQLLALLWSSAAAGSAVSSAAYSPNGSLIAFGYVSGTVQVAQAVTGVISWSIPYRDHNAIRSLVFSSDGKFIWMASGKDVLCVDFKTTTCITAAGHTSQVNAVARSPNGQFIASCANDATIRLWDAKTGKPRGSVLVEHDGPVISVAVSTDNNSLYSVGSDGTVREWNLTRTPSEHLKTILILLWGKHFEEGSGWLVDPSHSNRRLLWVPPEYRDDIKVSFNSRVVTAHWKYVGVGSKDGDLYYGERWTKCWSGVN